MSERHESDAPEAPGNSEAETVPGSQSGAGFDWSANLGESYKSFKPMLEAKGWKEPGDALKAYGELEKKLGKAVVVPGDNASEAERAAFHKRLGVPDAPDGYQLTKPEGVEGYDGSIAAWLRATGHRLALPSKALSGLHDAYFEDIVKPHLAQQAEARSAAKHQLEMEIHDNWPEAKQTAYLDCAKRGARFLGLAPERLDGLLDHVSDFALVEAMRKLGEMVGEDALVGGGSAPALGAEAARAELHRFKGDPEVQKAYADNRHPQHREVVARFNQLTERAYPIGG